MISSDDIKIQAVTTISVVSVLSPTEMFVFEEHVPLRGAASFLCCDVDRDDTGTVFSLSCVTSQII